METLVEHTCTTYFAPRQVDVKRLNLLAGALLIPARGAAAAGSSASQAPRPPPPLANLV